jgi:hypothetical protein
MTHPTGTYTLENHIEASGGCLSQYSGVARLRTDVRWCASLLSIEDCNRDVAEFSLHVVPWLRHSTEEVCVWLARKKVSHKPKASKKKVGAVPDPARPVEGDPDHSDSNCGTNSGVDIDDDDVEWVEELEGLAAALGLGGGEGDGDGGGGGCGGDAPPVDPGPGVEPPVLDVGPVVGPVAPPPPAPHPEPRGRGSGPPRYPEHFVSKDGRQIGFALVNTNASQIDVHCMLHGGSCRVGRSFVGVPEDAGAGSPMAGWRKDAHLGS